MFGFINFVVDQNISGREGQMIKTRFKTFQHFVATAENELMTMPLDQLTRLSFEQLDMTSKIAMANFIT